MSTLQRIANSIFALIPSWLFGGRHPLVDIPDVEPPPFPSASPIVFRREKRPTRAAKQRVYRHKHILETLNGLSETFRNLARRDVYHNHQTPPDIRRALRLLGPHIPPPEHDFDTYSKNDLEGRVADTHNMPTLMFLALNLGDRGGREGSMPDFFYAFKAKTVPWHTQFVDGEIYQCGLAWRHKKSGRLSWGGFYAGIDRATGRITVAREHEEKVTHINPTGAKVKARNYISKTASRQKSTTVRRTVWGAPGTAQRMEGGEAAAVSLVCEIFHFWEERKKYWHVSARRDGKRVTFCIAPENAKHYFKDRDSTAVSPSGQRARIIHLVREHVRASGARVREHIRGLRAFDWNGFECAITAPEFHRINADSFTAATLSEDDDAVSGRFDSEELARRLAAAEDAQDVRALKEAA